MEANCIRHYLHLFKKKEQEVGERSKDKPHDTLSNISTDTVHSPGIMHSV